MYAKLFTSIYQGTLRGKSHPLLVFTNLIAHADAKGEVDMHPRAIAEEVGLTLDEVKAALLELEAPDLESRSPDEEGRRIIRLDEHRAWGWRIVNYLKYRAIRNEDDRREQNRSAQERWRAKNKPESAKVSQQATRKPISAQAEAEAEAEIPSLLSQATGFQPPAEKPSALALVDSKPKGLPDCPHAEVLALWAEVLPALPQHNPSLWRGSRADHLRARWRETATEKGWQSAADGLAYFRRLFAYVGQSPFLTGRSRAVEGRPPFVAELAWLVMPQNWAKTIEGKYHTEAA